jgi:hypothetical protein
MQSSTNIGALATALAKAQSELANPEKSLVATLPSPVSGGAEKSFRYASLATVLISFVNASASMRSPPSRQPASTTRGA